MRVLIWHVHGSWTTSFVAGPDQYLIPVLPDRGTDGRGRARAWAWDRPSNAVELTPDRPITTSIIERSRRQSEQPA